MKKGILAVLKNPPLLFTILGQRELLNWMDDKTYLKIAFRARFGKPLNLKHPETFNEKLQWLKLYDRNPLYSQWVDKIEAKHLAAQIIGEEYIIPTLGVWEQFDDIDFDTLPDQFVLKCSHDSGGLVICKDKSKLDKAAAKAKIESCLKHSYFWIGREWPYQNVRPRILAEPYMEDSKTKELRDYKFFTFSGEVKALYIASGRDGEGHARFDFFDSDFHHLPVQQSIHPNADFLPEKPLLFDQMKVLAEKLSQGLPHVRVDFYEADRHIYFGEMTFYHMSGMAPFSPESWDKTFGDWLTLPPKKE